MKYKAVNTLLSSPAVLGLVNAKVERYGTVTKLAVDEGGCHAEVRLLGRDMPLNNTVGVIEFSDDGGRVTLRDLRGSEAWLQHLLEDFVAGKKFDMPAEARPFLKPLAKFF